MTLFQYIKVLNANLRTGSASEGAHRPALVELLETEKGIRAINEPAQIAGNAPDILVEQGGNTVGFIETKDIGKDLRAEISSEQLTRYRDAFPNLLLTNYMEWIWFVDGVEKEVFHVAHVTGGKIKLVRNAQNTWGDFIRDFLAWEMPSVASPQELAKHLAGKTRQLKTVAFVLLKSGDKEINAQYKTFREYLMPSMGAEEFADMFAQTISYGIFTARCFGKTGEIFARTRTENLIPASNPLLREFFHHITGPDLSPDLAVLVDNITEFLSRVDLHSILEAQGRKVGFEDPVFHFYETFLAAYDPKLREQRGVYYTPAPVVDFIVRGVDEILRTRFKRADGLADKNTLILDPAVGTATFLRRVVELIREIVRQKGSGGGWSAYVKDFLLPRIFGFEFMMAPYTVAHLKLALQLSESNYKFAKKERLQIFLTNTLDQIKGKTGQLMSRWLVDESEYAEAVKNKKPVMVVLGNPPYSGHSANKTGFAKRLIEPYKKGVPDLKKPGQAKWLSDDYVKFIGFAQWRVKKTGHGVVAFIANHAWLNNPTFRGMRASLLRDFDEIRIVDLHGSARRKERKSDGEKEENVFDIQQGVAIFFLIRKEGVDQEKDAQVFHRDLWGSRREKYEALAELKVDGAGWEEVKPFAPFSLFKPTDEELWGEYEKFPSIKEVFAPNGDPAPGVVTTHDDFAISWTPRESAEKVERLLATKNEEEARALFRLCSQKQWEYGRAKVELSDGDWREKIKPILYRPFDIRFSVFDRNVAVHRRNRVTRHMLVGGNVGIIVGRVGQADGSGEWRSVFISKTAIDFHILRSSSSCLFPLYVYPETDERNGSLDNGRKPNIAREFLHAVKSRIGAAPSPEEILHYVYAVLHSPAYRKRYADFLKSDFPRLPLTADKKRFVRLAKLGAQLAELHLHPSAFNDGVTKYPVSDGHKVDKVRYDEKNQRVYINKTQFFDGVQKREWAFVIGGYQVLDKYLKDRKGRQLTYDDIHHYQCTASAVRKTLQLMKAVDKAIGKWPMA